MKYLIYFVHRTLWQPVRAFAAAVLLLTALGGGELRADRSLADVILQVQPKMVKIYGAGGFRGMEPYQSGFLISANGFVLTVWSYVLDTDYITVTLNDGRKFDAKIAGADPQLELALLKIDSSDLPHFKLSEAVESRGGTRILAMSNLFGVATGNEPMSVQRGVISVKTRLEARRGMFETPYRGPVYVLDAVTNNPGAAGGALIDRRGRLLGMLGKELRNSLNYTWLNYAIPIPEISQAAEDIRAGKSRPRLKYDKSNKVDNPLTLAMLGIVLVPDIVEKTPPYIDEVYAGFSAAKQGLLSDDLVIFVEGRLVQSCKALGEELERIEKDESVRLTVMRGQRLIEVVLKAPQNKSNR